MLNGKKEIADVLNSYGRKKTPVLFIIDFDMNESVVLPIHGISSSDIMYDINGFTNTTRLKNYTGEISIKKSPISFKKYENAFNHVINEFRKGNSFLLNLTFPTEININLELKEIYSYSRAKYKLFFNDQFTVFSPETFVRISGDTIRSFPMKGTINASVPDAEKTIINDEKEFAEHITIVDLIRNDLGMVSDRVDVERFRYIDRLITSEGELLQVSSAVSGKLAYGWQSKLGDIITSLLPAGSVTGAPKKKTVEIIKSVENYDRGFYTGIFGYFDGENLDSGVMIRFIERKDGGKFFKSGGGLTIYSDVNKEYNELLEKIYVPVY